MSDILVKNMEMPTECLECPLKDCDNAWDFGYTRPDDCPLVEVKPHGRLIDAGKMADDYMRYLMYCFPSMQVSTVNELVSAVKEAVKIAPFVLEASNE